MSDYLTDVQLLEAELVQVEQTFRGLADSDGAGPPCCSHPAARCHRGPSSSSRATLTSRSA